MLVYDNGCSENPGGEGAHPGKGVNRMSVQAFVDESQRGPRYLMGAALIDPRDLAAARARLRAMLLPGQRRLHFNQERPPRRRSLLSAMSDLDVRVRLYESTEKQETARQQVMASLLADLIDLECRRIVIEGRNYSQNDKERRAIAAAIRLGHAPEDLVYDHMRAHEEPLLWVADAVAWAYGARGEWRPRIAGLVDHVRRL